jgi:chaperonin cofactor prefoldin
MAEIDKIIEAEKTISTISKELSKMKSAVELLESTKIKADAVIKTGESVVKNINTFVEQGTSIIEKIGDYDIKTEVEKLSTQMKDLKKDVKGQTKALSDSIDKMDKQFENNLAGFRNVLKDNQEKADQNQIYLYFAIGANILIAGAVALKIFGFIN